MYDPEKENETGGMSAARKAIAARLQGALKATHSPTDSRAPRWGISMGANDSKGSPSSTSSTPLFNDASQNGMHRQQSLQMAASEGGGAGSRSSGGYHYDGAGGGGGGVNGLSPTSYMGDSGRNTPFLTTNVDSGVYDHSNTSSAVLQDDNNNSQPPRKTFTTTNSTTRGASPPHYHNGNSRRSSSGMMSGGGARNHQFREMSESHTSDNQDGNLNAVLAGSSELPIGTESPDDGGIVESSQHRRSQSSIQNTDDVHSDDDVDMKEEESREGSFDPQYYRNKTMEGNGGGLISQRRRSQSYSTTSAYPPPPSINSRSTSRGAHRGGGGGGGEDSPTFHRDVDLNVPISSNSGRRRASTMPSIVLETSDRTVAMSQSNNDDEGSPNNTKKSPQKIRRLSIAVRQQQQHQPHQVTPQTFPLQPQSPASPGLYASSPTTSTSTPHQPAAAARLLGGGWDAPTNNNSIIPITSTSGDRGYQQQRQQYLSAGVGADSQRRFSQNSSHTLPPHRSSGVHPSNQFSSVAAASSSMVTDDGSGALIRKISSFLHVNVDKPTSSSSPSTPSSSSKPDKKKSRDRKSKGDVSSSRRQGGSFTPLKSRKDKDDKSKQDKKKSKSSKSSKSATVDDNPSSNEAATFGFVGGSRRGTLNSESIEFKIPSFNPITGASRQHSLVDASYSRDDINKRGGSGRHKDGGGRHSYDGRERRRDGDGSRRHDRSPKRHMSSRGEKKHSNRKDKRGSASSSSYSDSEDVSRDGSSTSSSSSLSSSSSSISRSTPSSSRAGHRRSSRRRHKSSSSSQGRAKSSSPKSSTRTRRDKHDKSSAPSSRKKDSDRRRHRDEVDAEVSPFISTPASSGQHINNASYMGPAEAALITRSVARPAGGRGSVTNITPSRRRTGDDASPPNLNRSYTTSPGGRSNRSRHSGFGDDSTLADRRNWINAPGRVASRSHVVGGPKGGGDGSEEGGSSSDGMMDLRVRPRSELIAFEEEEQERQRQHRQQMNPPNRRIHSIYDEASMMSPTARGGGGVSHAGSTSAGNAKVSAAMSQEARLLDRLQSGGGYRDELLKTAHYGINGSRPNTSGRGPQQHRHQRYQQQGSSDSSSSDDSDLSDDDSSTLSSSYSDHNNRRGRRRGHVSKNSSRSKKHEAAVTAAARMRAAEDALAPPNQSRLPYWVGHGRIPTLEMKHTVDDKLAIATAPTYLSFRAGVLHKNGDKMVYFSAAATEVQAQERKFKGRSNGNASVVERLKDTDAVLRPRGVVVCDQHLYVLSLPSNVLFAPASTGGCFNLSEFVKVSKVQGKPFMALQFLGAVVLLRFTKEEEALRLGDILRSATGVPVDTTTVTEDNITVAQRAMLWRRGKGGAAGAGVHDTLRNSRPDSEAGEDEFAPVNTFVTATMGGADSPQQRRRATSVSSRRGGGGGGTPATKCIDSEEDDDNSVTGGPSASSLRRNTATVGSSAFDGLEESPSRGNSKPNNMAGFLQDVFMNLDDDDDNDDGGVADRSGEEESDLVDMGANISSGRAKKRLSTSKDTGGRNALPPSMQRLYPSRSTQTNSRIIVERNTLEVGTYTGVSTLERGASPIRFDMYGQMIPCSSITKTSASPALYTNNGSIVGSRQDSVQFGMGGRQESMQLGPNVSFAANGASHLLRGSHNNPQNSVSSSPNETSFHSGGGMAQNPSFHSLGNAAMQMASRQQASRNSPRRGPLLRPSSNSQLPYKSLPNTSFSGGGMGRYPTDPHHHHPDNNFNDGSVNNHSFVGSGDIPIPSDASPAEQQRLYWINQHQGAVNALREREQQLSELQGEEEDRMRLKMRLIEEERKSSAARAQRSEDRHADWENHFSEGSPSPGRGDGDSNSDSNPYSPHPPYNQNQNHPLNQSPSGGTSQGREGSEFSHADLWNVLRRGDTPTRKAAHNNQPGGGRTNNKTPSQHRNIPTSGRRGGGNRSSKRKSLRSSDDTSSNSDESSDDGSDRGSDLETRSTGNNTSDSSEGDDGKRKPQQQQQHQPSKKGSNKASTPKKGSLFKTPSNRRTASSKGDIGSDEEGTEGLADAILSRVGGKAGGVASLSTAPPLSSVGGTPSDPKARTPNVSGGTKAFPASSADTPSASGADGNSGAAFEQFLGLLAAPYKPSMDRHGIHSAQSLKDAVSTRAEAIFKDAMAKKAAGQAGGQPKGIIKKNVPQSIQECYTPAIQQLLSDLGVTRTGHRLLFNSKISMLMGGGGTN